LPNNKHQPSQLPLDLPVDNNISRDDLVVGDANSVAIELIDQWPDWQASVLILAGPTGSGKSHLASIWAEKAQALIYPATELASADNKSDEAHNFVIEDISEARIDETALFHLINSCSEKGGYCLLTSSSWPQSWNISLPDLSSRLRAATLVELREPDDLLLKQTLIKLFADRQIHVDRNVIDYLVLRMERSVKTARIIVEKLDQLALATRKPITRSMAAKILELLEG
jgi:chromosomal replication initiation ATPase DnaA